MNDTFDSFIATLQNTTSDSSRDTPVTAKKRRIATPEPQSTPKDSPFGLVDVNRIEYAARNLQKHIKMLLDESPDLSELSAVINDESIDRNIRMLIQASGLLLLSASLKSLHKQGSLPVFDAILENKLDSFQSSSSPPGVPLNADVTQKVAATTLDYQSEDDEEFRDNGYPPLPKIKDPRLKKRVFIHKSTVNNKSYLQQSELINSHNERLEFLGDSILNNLVTVIIYNRFPNAPEGDLSKMRALLINNMILAEFSLAYGFDRKLVSNVDAAVLRQGKQKIFADIFEAYIGALAIEHKLDFTEIKEWLAKLMKSKLHVFDKQLRQTEPINKDAKSELYSLIGTAAFHPIYTTIETGDGADVPFVIRCTMGEDTLGEGIAPGLKEAGLRAAMVALRNKPLLEKYSQLRLNTDKTQSMVKTKIALSNQSLTPEPPVAANDNTTKPGNSSKFPLVANDEDLIEPDAKNELYALLGKNLGLIPEYTAAMDQNTKKFKVEVKVKNFVVAVAFDASKRKGMTKAAMTVLKHKDSLTDLFNIIG